MDLRNLELFLHLADSLHFGKSADAMAVSPSTLSRAIQRLEQETGCILFERDNRSVRLTPAGEKLRELPHPSTVTGLAFDGKGKWVKLEGWGNAAEAKAILADAMTRYQDEPDKPNF